MRQKFQTAERSLISVRLNINSFFTLCLFCKFENSLSFLRLFRMINVVLFVDCFFLIDMAAFYCSTYITVKKKGKKNSLGFVRHCSLEKMMKNEYAENL